MSAMIDSFKTLNEKQLLAVENTVKQICIIAGPGTGKTKTLVARINYLLTENRVEPSSILALTFTKKAAREIEERVRPVVGKEKSKGLFVGTFHSFGMEVLRKGLKDKVEEIKIITEPERNELIKKLAREGDLKGTLKEYTSKELSLAISNEKNHLRVHDKSDRVSAGAVLELVSLYNQALAEKNLFDFDDLIRKAYELLASSKELITQLRAQYKHVLIDEFQDTNEIQYELIKEVITPDTSLFVIGDPLQSIYAFRGARGDIFDKLISDFPGTLQITLNTNYRSARKIIRASHQLFPSSIELMPAASENGAVQIVTTLNDYSEADWIVNKISEFVGGLDLNQSSDLANATTKPGTEKDIVFSDFAVIYRTHGMSRALERKFRASSIPFQKIGEGSIYLRPEIADLIGAFKNLNGKVSLDNKKLTTLANEIIKVQKSEEKLKDKPDRLIDLHAFINDMLRFDDLDDPLKEFLEHIEQIESEEYYDPFCDKVTLLTMHAAKGLEFKYVFICGFDKGFMPFERGIKFERGVSKVDQDEEKRLLYVAMTRAKQALFITHAKERLGQKNIKISDFNEFLTSSDIEYLQDEQIAKIEKWRVKQKAKKSQMKMF